MTVASLVQAEGRGDDMPKIARVIYNRLENEPQPERGLPADRRDVNYALGRPGIAVLTDRRDRLGRGLAVQHLHAEGPAPGSDRVARATTPSTRPRNPAEGQWFFYVTVNLKTGETKFAESYDEFLTVQAGAPRLLRQRVRRCVLRCAVLGDPIAHSLSPVLHRAGYAAVGLD